MASQQDVDEFDSSCTDGTGDDADDAITQVDRTVPITAATTKQYFSTTYESMDHAEVAMQKIHVLERKVAFLLYVLGIEDISIYLTMTK